MEKLTTDAFLRFPVWKWDDDETEREPVQEWNLLPYDDCALFIRSTFVSADGTDFEGYVIGSRDFYALGIFAGDGEFIFNVNLPDLMQEELRRLNKCLNRDDLRLFPLQFSLDERVQSHPTPSGTITLS